MCLNSVTIPSITDIIQVAFTIIGGVYALYLFKQSNKEKRNKVIIQIYNSIYQDDDIRTVIYTVDSGDISGMEQIKYQGSLERQIDKTLRYFDYIGYLIKNRSIRKKDISPFRYEINRTLTNPAVKKYIKWCENIGINFNYLKYCPQNEPKLDFTELKKKAKKENKQK